MSLRRHPQIVTSDGRAVEDASFLRTHGLRCTEELRPDNAEHLFLRVFRDLCVGLFCDADEGVAAVHAFVVGREAREACIVAFPRSFPPPVPSNIRKWA